jgi:flagellar hook-basal body complex protein FliE
MSTINFPSVQQTLPLSNNNKVTKTTTPFETQQSFASVLKDSIDQVNKAQLDSDQMTAKLASGQNVDLSQVMIAQQKANITLQAAVEVRNKVIDAYQEMMRMQV